MINDKVSLVYVGVEKTFERFDLRYGDVYEFEGSVKLIKGFIYDVYQVRNSRIYLGTFACPIDDDFITIAEWREMQIKSVIDEKN